MCCELSVICLVASRKWIPYPLWNLILWTTLLPSRWPKVYSKISLHNVFSTNIVVSRLILKMRSEDMLLEKLCISPSFHSVTWQHFFKLEYAQLVSQAIKADPEAAEHFVCHPRLSTNHHCNERFQKLVIFVCWLALNYKSVVTFYWGMRSSHKKTPIKIVLSFFISRLCSSKNCRLWTCMYEIQGALYSL